jgi:hypothetical protein
MASGGGSTVLFKAGYFYETREHYITNFAIVSHSNKYYLLFSTEQQPLVSQDLLIVEVV